MPKIACITTSNGLCYADSFNKSSLSVQSSDVQSFLDGEDLAKQLCWVRLVRLVKRAIALQVSQPVIGVMFDHTMNTCVEAPARVRQSSNRDR